MLIERPRGTKDILPDAVGNWRYAEEKVRDICKKYGFREIRTPLFEHTELFQRGIGDTTDVVEKEMYSFTDRGGRSVTLRPENTAAAVRAYLQNKLYADSQLTKLFYIGSMFRYDRPQAGRQREFHQFGVEALGVASPAVDAEVILLATRLLQSLGLKNLSLSINSVGCPKCRPVYRKALQDFLAPKLDGMCDNCKSRFDRNPLRLLDCKEEKCHQLNAGAPEIADCLCDECRDHFEKLKSYLTALGLKYELDPRLVRGLDYYTKTAFEIKYDNLGAQSAVCGGGRYDGLVEEIGGPATPAVGFAVGLERVLLVLEEQGLLPDSEEKLDVYMVSLGESAKQTAFALTDELRQAGLVVEADLAGRSMKAQMKSADKSGAHFAILIGEDEVASETVQFRDLKAGTQEPVARKDILARIESLK